MSTALDPEMEIVATLIDDRACAVYQRDGLDGMHFADPKAREVFEWAMSYYNTHGHMEHAPTIEVLMDEFPDYGSLVANVKGAAPSYLCQRLKNEYVRRQASEAVKMYVSSMNEDALQSTTMMREALSGIVESCSSPDEVLVYGEDLDAYRRKLAESRDHRGVPYPWKEMQEHTGGIHDGELAVLVAPPSTGKAQPLDSQVLTDGGWVRMGDLKVGDMVKTRSGGSAPITGIFPKGKLDVYQVTFADGRKMLCNDEHLFTIVYKGKNSGKPAYKERVVSVREMLDKGIVDRFGRHRWMVPRFDAMEFKEVEHVIDPYVLGVLIGDGYLTGSGLAFSQNEQDIVERVAGILGEDYRVSKANSDNYSYGIRALRYITINGCHRHPIKVELNRLGLEVKSPQRFIPDEYMWDSAANRRALLEGLFDTDGCVSLSGGFSYSTRSEQLAKDVQALARSLGYGSRVNYNDRGEGGVDISVSIITNDRIFRSSKHNRRFDEYCANRRVIHSSRMPIVDIKPLGYKTEMQCIMVDDPDHLYVTDEYCLTHNTVFACKMALECIRQGHNVFFASLELPIETITTRIEYMVVNERSLQVYIHEYQTGKHVPEWDAAIRKAQEEIRDMPGKLVVAHPRVEDRTPTALVRACKSHGCKLLIVDQLQFVQKPRRDTLQESYGAALQEFKQQIMSPVDGERIPLLLLHQMNRSGAKAQHEGMGRVGFMTDIAGSAWVEQISDVVWGIGRNDEERNNNLMNIATLKVRSMSTIGWQLSWDTDVSFQFDILRDENGNARRLETW